MTEQSLSEVGKHELLFNLSERQVRKLAPKKYTEVFLADEVTKEVRIVGVQDTSDTEALCKQMRQDAPDFRHSFNKDRAKRLHVLRIPAGLLTKMFGTDWRKADQKTFNQMARRAMREHPEFLVQNPSMVGL